MQELAFEGLLPEEDYEVSLLHARRCSGPSDAMCADTKLCQVPGGANDSLTSNTRLGRAVQDACAELEALGKLVRATHCG